MKLFKNIYLILVLFLLFACGKKDDSNAEVKTEEEAPSFPDSEIYVATIAFEDNLVTIGSILNLTNREGYDNQPQFTLDEMGVLFSSIRDNKQSDIYRYDFFGKNTVQVTDTPESEYSPTPLPGGGFSTVRVEQDDTQRLWRMGDGGEGAELVLKDLKGVGYHGWISDDQVALLVVGDDEKNIPHTLHLANAATGESVKILDNPGRALLRIPDDSGLSFVDKTDPSTWWIKRLDLTTKETTNIVQTLKGSEDFVWTPNKGILMAQGTELYHWGRCGGDWKKVVNLKGKVTGPINRLSLNNEGSRLAIVAVREEGVRQCENLYRRLSL